MQAYRTHPHQSSGNSALMLSLKVVLASVTVLSIAIMLKVFAFPTITDFMSVYQGVSSWLRPPYLYLVINCIIITIVASSKLQSSMEGGDASAAPAPSPPPLQTVVQVQPIKDLSSVTTSPVSDLFYSEGVVEAEKVVSQPEVVFGYGRYDGGVDARVTETETEFTVTTPAAVEREENKENEFVISKSNWASSPRYSAEKPPASARFSHRKTVKASPEGGKAALGVSKSKRHDTLESTWKTITEGRSMPLTRHLRKSDTWETHNSSRHHQQLQKENVTPQPQKMTKSETFPDRNVSPLTPSPGSGKLRKEPSLSQDELNRRVEAFIKKFNEEMRLQRQESLNQYMEMIKRGSN